MNDTTATPKRKMGCGTWLLIGVGGFIVLSVLGSQQQEKDKADRHAAAVGQAAVAKPELAVTPAELRQAYEANEVAAKQRYEGQRLRLTGRLHAIDLDLTDDPTLVFSTDKEYERVHAGFTKDDSAAIGGLRKGQEVTVLCDRVTEVIGTPILRDCSLVQ